MIVVADAAHLAAMRAHAERAYPEECCGLLVGEVDGAGIMRVSEVVAGVNVATDRRRRFEVDPQLRIDLMRRLRGSDQGIIGHYHSHPDAPAEPSANDRDRAVEPHLVWLIVSVRDGRADAVGAFRPAADASGGAPALSPIVLRETA